MAEIEIQRTNFFDGQFLKQAEFLDLDAYHLHMRRRWGFVLFDQSGVLETTPIDLTVTAAGGTKIVVKAGMAIGKRPELAEAKEIVLTADSAAIDIAVQSANVPTALSGGDTGIVTVHYVEEPVAQPPSEGDVPGNTRIKEHAQITVHKNTLPGPNASNNEPFVTIGRIPFNSMVPNVTGRQTAHLNVALVAAVAQISVSPNTVPGTGNVVLTVNSSGGLDLSAANAGSIAFSSMNGISNIAVSNQQPTSLTLSFTLTAANAGARTLTVTTNLTASTTLTIQAGLQVTSFAGVNEPNNDLLFKINGSSFSGVTLVDFTKGGGGTTQVTLGGGNVTPNQLTIPLAQIPSDAVVGPVKVQSNGQTVTSGSNATPPAKVTAFAGSVARGTTLTITGLRFVSPLHIRIVKANVEIVHKSTATGFPNGIQGESMTDTQLVVLIPPATPTGASELRIETDGGVIVGGPLTITL